jgi:hypothetical protein
LSYRAARLGIDSWASKKVYKSWLWPGILPAIQDFLESAEKSTLKRKYSQRGRVFTVTFLDSQQLVTGITDQLF